MVVEEEEEGGRAAEEEEEEEEGVGSEMFNALVWSFDFDLRDMSNEV